MFTLLPAFALWAAAVEPGAVASGPLELARFEGVPALARRVWAEAPELKLQRAQLAAAMAEAERAGLLPNPTLGLSAGTLPLGTTNPPDLASPWTSIPNFNVSASVLVELGKRGPRQEATRHALRAARLDAIDAVRGLTSELLDTIGEIAATEARIGALSGILDDAARLQALQSARVNRGDASPLDADRAELDRAAVGHTLSEAQAALRQALRRCTEQLGAPCKAFGDAARARAFLVGTLERRDAELETRADLRALEATRDAAAARGLLAERRAIPDPTIQVGYTHDRFVVSGNQQNSLAVALSIPLPLFDHGQADARAAIAERRAAEDLRTARLTSGRAQRAALTEEREAVEAHARQLAETTLPLARAIVERLDAAVTRGAAPLPELLLARRSLADLLIAAIDLDRELFRLDLARLRLGAAPFDLDEQTIDAP